MVAGEVPEDNGSYYVKPVIFSDVKPDMRIAQEEIFGPVLVVIPYETQEEAVQIANDSIYGLAGAVFGPEEEANKVARQMKTGTVYVNEGQWDLLLRLEDINNPDSEEKAEWKDTKNFLRLKPSTTNKNQFGGFCPPHQKRGLYAPSFQVSSLNYKNSGPFLVFWKETLKDKIIKGLLARIEFPAGFYSPCKAWRAENDPAKCQR